MNIFKFFQKPKRNSAQMAKERLQIIVSHENARKTGSDIVQRMQQELLAVICKYVHIDQDKIKVQLEKHGDQSILELNVTLPDGGLMNLTAPTSEENQQPPENESQISSKEKSDANKAKDHQMQNKSRDKTHVVASANKQKKSKHKQKQSLEAQSSSNQ